MSTLVQEIEKLSLLKAGSIYPVYQGEDVVYLNKSNDGYAIAIPFDDPRTFNESFVGIELSTNMLNFNDTSLKVLYLFMSSAGDLKKFCYIGAEFIDVENRESLLNNPYKWVDSWIEMFGDAKKKFLITDVIAELVSLKTLFEKDKTAKWMGPKDGTHDIVLEKGVVEVKSTTHKTNNYISINSRFQINTEINEKLFFVRLEPKPYANSIDSLVEELIFLGYPKNELEENLEIMGYKKGNRTRRASYQVLSLVSYDVNSSNFPDLTLEQINNLTLPQNIVGYELKLDLSNINGEIIL